MFRFGRQVICSECGRQNCVHFTWESRFAEALLGAQAVADYNWEMSSSRFDEPPTLWSGWCAWWDGFRQGWNKYVMVVDAGVSLADIFGDHPKPCTGKSWSHNEGYMEYAGRRKSRLAVRRFFWHFLAATGILCGVGIGPLLGMAGYADLCVSSIVGGMALSMLGWWRLSVLGSNQVL